MEMDNTIEIVGSGKFMQMVRDGRWEYVRRHTAEGAVAILATTDEGELVLVEQFRVPMGCACLELPAGLVGDTEADKGEALRVAAERELLEETGYAAAQLEHLYPIATSPGLSSEMIDLFRATGLSKKHDGGGIEHEEITVHLVKVSELDGWLAQRREQGVVIDVKVYFALALLQRA
ncbi:MAG: NUDIX hydrolase [Phycisphaeraceae bacterium]|nr:NUDIX hydrolase [Phycisphaeraceae bacterium]